MRSTSNIRVVAPAPDINDPTPEWMRRGVCRVEKVPTSVFFPNSSVPHTRHTGDAPEIRQVAARYCARCDVREECLAWAIREHLTHGVYGGLGPRGRQRHAEEQPVPVPIIPRRTKAAIEGRVPRTNRPLVRIVAGDGDRRHGTVSGYINHACRCPACRTAASEYKARRRRLANGGAA